MVKHLCLILFCFVISLGFALSQDNARECSQYFLQVNVLTPPVKVDLSKLYETDEQFQKQLSSMGVATEPVEIETFLENGFYGRPEIVMNDTRPLFMGKIYKILNLPQPEKSQGFFAKALKHPQMAFYKERMEKLGHSLVIDSSLPHSGAAGYYWAPGKIIAITPDCEWGTFIHEFQHLEFQVFLSHRLPELRDKVRRGLDIESLLAETGVYSKRSSRLRKLLSRELPSNSINETLSVNEELKLLGFRRYWPHSRASGMKIYVLKHQINDLTNLSKARALTPIEEKTLKDATKRYLALLFYELGGMAGKYVAIPSLAGYSIWELIKKVREAHEEKRFSSYDYQQIIYNDQMVMAQDPDGKWDVWGI